MTLKLVTNEVPVGLETHYTKQDDGRFRLNVEDAVSKEEFDSTKTKLDEFRTNNKTLFDENKKFKNLASIIGSENLDPDTLQKKIDSLADEKAAAMKTAFDTEKTDLSGKLTKYSTKVVELTLGSEITKAATAHGVVSSALEDVHLRAKNAFEVDEDGNVKIKNGLKDSKGKEYTVDSWMQEMKSKASHWFAQSQGTGAKKNFKGDGSNGSRVGVADTRSAVQKIASGFNKDKGAIKKLA